MNCKQSYKKPLHDLRDTILRYAVFIAGRGSISATLISNRVTLRQAGTLTVSLCALEQANAAAGSGQISQQSAFSPSLV